MKKGGDLLLQAGVGSTVFILLIVVSMALVRPAFLRLTAGLSMLEQAVLKSVEEKTGLAVVYEKLSPSILSGLNLKGVSLNDSATGKKVAEISRITVAYRFSDFFKKKPLYAIKSVSVSGLTLEYDAVKDGALFKKLRTLFPEKEPEVKREKKTVDFENLSLNLPFLVQIRNIALHYSDEKNDALLTVKQVALTSRFDSKGIEVSTEGRISCSSDYLTEGGRPVLLASSFSLAGTFFPDLNGSTATLRLMAVNNADYTVSNAEFLANYTDTKLQVRSMRSVLPYSLYLEADSKAKTASVSASFSDFDPLSLIRIKKMPPILHKMDGLRLDGSVSAAFAGAAQKSSRSRLTFSVDTKAALPPALTGKPLNLALQMSGDEAALRIARLVATGENMQASFSGGYNMKTRQPSGTLSLDYFVLKNGGVLSTEVYVEPMQHGFMLFSPQFFFGERSLTALQLTAFPAADSWDFVFECDDYSHADYGSSGHIRLEGSYLQKSAGGGSYVQTQLSLSNLFVDSILLDAAFFMKESTGERLRAAAKNLSPYLVSSDIYASSDFKNFSFNAPLFLMANTKNDHELLMFSADGSNQTVQLSNLELQFGSNSASASIMADFDRGIDDFTFFGEASVNGLPYRFNGNYASDWLSVSGDYDMDAAVALGDTINGSLHFSALPVSLAHRTLAFSADTAFSWSELVGPSVEIYSFAVEDASGSSALSPKLTFTGTVNHNSLVLSSIAYSDVLSVLDGSGNILWNINDGIFDSIHIDMSASSPLSPENLTFSVDFVNPQQLPFSVDALQNDFYLSAEASLSHFVIGRLLKELNGEDLLSAGITASGTMSNPFLTVNVSSATLSLLGSPLLAAGNFSFDDTGLHIVGIDGNWKDMSISGLSADFDPTAFSGQASCTFEASLLGQSILLPLTLSVESAPPVERWRIPANYTVSLSSPQVSGSFFLKPFPLDLTLLHMPGRYDLFTPAGFSATLLADGSVTASSAPGAKTSFMLNGALDGENLNLAFTNIKADLAELSSRINFEYVQFAAGVLSGSFRIKGILTDPDFSGAVAVEAPSFTVPFVSTSPFKTKRLLAAIGDSTLVVDPTRFENGKGVLDVSSRLEFDRWKLDMLSVHLKAVDEKYVPVDMLLPLVHFKGGAAVDLSLLLTMNEFNISGTIYGQNGEIELQTSSWQSAFTSDSLNFSSLFAGKQEASELPFDISCDLHMVARNRIQILYNPFLRGLIAPDTSLYFATDTGTGSFSLKGDVALRGGEVIWLNRNFYMKEGRIVFNETQDLLDPRLTVRAETRERDSSGNAVTITLSASNQPLSVFNPRLSASPARSESEIMELLGEIVSADSDSAAGVATAAGDYLVNATVMRRIENSLRELTNFDIFSVRTMVLQNAVNQSTRSDSDENATTFGNFFDNSTVYVGKYFGSSVYVDALMQWTYDETKSNESGDVNSLVFHPELGFEMTSPFVNIRWGIAPDIEAIQTSKPWFVPSASITLSWKISF